MLPITQTVRQVGAFIGKNSPTIMAVIGIAGVPTTGALAYFAYPKYQQLRDDALREKGEPLTAFEEAKSTWRAWLPPVLVGGCTMTAIFASNRAHLRRNAIIAGLYTASESTLREYRRRVVDTIGKNKEENIRAEMAQDYIEKNPPNSKGNDVIVTPGGIFLCEDAYTGRYFTSSVDTINRAVNEINRRITTGMEMYASLNDFYSELGLADKDVGDVLGWNIDNLCEVRFTSILSSKNEPCIVMDYSSSVVADYKDIMLQRRRPPHAN